MGRGNCFRPKVYPYVGVQGLKDRVHKTAFPNSLDTKDMLDSGLCPQQTCDK